MFESISWRLDPETVFQLGYAMALGGVVGLEREVRGRSAGLRTLALVCLGSTLIMIVSHELSFHQPEALEAIVRVDPGRIAAGIVTGIGFLGAGVILKLGDLIRGVTTAASIWFVAAVGLAIGLRYYALAAVATLLALFVLWLLNLLEHLMRVLLYRTVVVRMRAAESETALDGVRSVLMESGGRVMDLKASEDVDAGITEVELTLRTTQKYQGHQVVKALGRIGGVVSASWR